MKNSIRNILLGTSLMVLTSPCFATAYEALADDAPCRIVSLQKKASIALLTKGLSTPDQRELARRMNDLSDNYLFSLIYDHNVHSILENIINMNERAFLLNSFQHIPIEQWADHTQRLHPIFSYFQDIKPPLVHDQKSQKHKILGRVLFFYHLLKAPRFEQEEIARAASDLLRGAPMCDKLIDILKIVIELPKEERKPSSLQCAELAHSFSSISATDRSYIIETLLTLPQHERAEFTQLYKTFIQHAPIEGVYAQPDGPFGDILKMLAKIPSLERIEFAFHSPPFVAGCSRYFYNQVERFIKLPPIERAECYNLAYSLSRSPMHRETSGHVRGRMIHLERSKRAPYINLALYLHGYPLTDSRYLAVLNMLSEFPPAECVSIMQATSNLLRHVKHDDVCLDVIANVIQFLPEERFLATSIATPLVISSTIGRGNTSSLIIDFRYRSQNMAPLFKEIAQIASDERQTVITAGAPLFEKTTNVFARAGIIKILAQLPASQRQTFALENAPHIIGIRNGGGIVSLLKKRAKIHALPSAQSASSTSSSSVQEPNPKRSRRS